MKEISDNLYNYLEQIGLIDPTGIRLTHVGKSNYSEQIIQPWTLWLAFPELTSWDHDIFKRIIRIKEEPGLSPEEARIMDYEKIKHDCDERIRQLKFIIKNFK